jgi:DNA-binding transcriptional regulator YiaG
MTSKYISLIEELNLEQPKQKFTTKTITPDFLKKLTNEDLQEDRKSIHLKISSIAIILRVTTTKVAEYLSGASEMEDWRKVRLVQMLNLLNQTEYQNRSDFTKWVTSSILEKRKKSTQLQEFQGLESFFVNHYLEIFNQSGTWEKINQLKSSQSGHSKIHPDLIIRDPKSKTAEIIEFDFSNDIENQKKKLHTLGYYLFYLSNNRISELTGFKISGVLVCSKPSRQLATEASLIKVTVKELTFKLKEVSF